MRRSYYLIACAIAALMPFVSPRLETPATGAEAVTFPGWPSTFEGKTLTPLPLTGVEKKFATGFPGRIARFSDGEREIIIRWVTEATRMMHPASDCFQGLVIVSSHWPRIVMRMDRYGPASPLRRTMSDWLCLKEFTPIPARRGRTFPRGTGQRCVTTAAAPGGR